MKKKEGLFHKHYYKRLVIRFSILDYSFFFLEFSVFFTLCFFFIRISNKSSICGRYMFSLSLHSVGICFRYSVSLLRPFQMRSFLSIEPIGIILLHLTFYTDKYNISTTRCIRSSQGIIIFLRYYCLLISYIVFLVLSVVTTLFISCRLRFFTVIAATYSSSSNRHTQQQQQLSIIELVY